MRTQEEIRAAYHARQAKIHGSAEAASKHREEQRSSIRKALSKAKPLSREEMSKDYGSNFRKNRHMPHASL